MKFQLPERAFPPLVLSAREEQELIDEADRIIEATIAAQEAFLARGRKVQSDQWKHLKTKEGMNVYRQRSVGASKKLFDPIAATTHAESEPRAAAPLDSVASTNTVASSSWMPGARGNQQAGTPASMFSFRSAKTPASRRQPASTRNMPMLDDLGQVSPTSSADHTSGSSEREWMEYQRKPADVPGLLAVGVVDGRLEDAMYGVFSEDDASWRWKSSQINDKLDDARVLATIRGPTREDPFRFIGVKWFTKEHPNALSSIVKRRDFLTIEAMGMTYDSTGTVRLGYFMMHSVEIPRIPVLSDLDILRGQASFCFILRQVQNSAIEIFVRGFSDPQGEMLEGVSVRLACESVLAAVKIVDFAHIKKLRWLMMNRRRDLPSDRSNHDESTCRSCQKGVKRLSSFLQGSAATCQVCREPVCSKCTITKHITVDISVDGATQKPLPFCLSCVMEAKNLSAWDIALENVTQRQYNLLPTDLFPGKSSAPSSSTSKAGENRDLRRAASTPRIQRQHSTGNSRMRSASQVLEQQARRKDQDKVLLYT